MTHTYNSLFNSTTRYGKYLRLFILAFMLGLTSGIPYRSADALVSNMPALSGEEAISHLKGQQLYGSLSEAMQSTIANVDTSVGRGNASLQMSAGTIYCITDRDIRNDSSICQ
jgi:hypothetical protein